MELAADERSYLEQRAEAELELACRATDGRAVQAHYALANHYLDRLHGTSESTAGAH